ncbi:MAG: hypothetical protein IIA50_05190 [Bacteroidetes bacterium]|nr:hypothetical protein [Bacteroidota bacterium]
MRTIRLLVEYDGTPYNGWQIQEGHPNARTIQGELELAIAVLKLNAETHADDFSIFDHLGKAFLQACARREAIVNFEKSVALNPENVVSLKILDRLKEE